MYLGVGVCVGGWGSVLRAMMCVDVHMFCITSLHHLTNTHHLIPYTPILLLVLQTYEIPEPMKLLLHFLLGSSIHLGVCVLSMCVCIEVYACVCMYVYCCNLAFPTPSHQQNPTLTHPHTCVHSDQAASHRCGCSLHNNTRRARGKLRHV